MSTQNYQDYKPSKKIKEQLDYLEEKKKLDSLIWIEIQQVINCLNITILM